MKKFLILPVLLFFFFSTKAQDTIFSKQFDTIPCRILSFTKQRIFYEAEANDGTKIIRDFPLHNLARYSSSEDLMENPYQQLSRDNIVEHVPLYSWCLGLSIGPSTLTSYTLTIPEANSIYSYGVPDQSIFHTDLRAHYMIRNYMGLGAEYIFYKEIGEQTLQDIHLMPNTSAFFDEYRHYFNFAGPSVLFQQNDLNGNPIVFREVLSAGLLFIRLEDQVTYPWIENSIYSEISSNILISGRAFGAKLGVSGNYYISDDFTMGFEALFFWGKLEKVNYEFNGSHADRESLDNTDLKGTDYLTRIGVSLLFNFHL